LVRLAERRSKSIGEFMNEGVAEFLPPSRGQREDWVLVLDDAAADIRRPVVDFPHMGTVPPLFA